jgi:bla regulator protein blaR1
MKEFLITELKVSLALTLFYMVYKLLLGSDTFFVRNRFYFLGVMLISFISPWLKFETRVYQTLPLITYTPSYTTIATPVLQAKETSIWTVVTEVAIIIYFLGILLYLVRFAWAYNKVIGLILKSEKRKFQNLILVITRLSVSPFSFLKWLVIPANQVDHPGFENIVQHESIHCRQYHSVDLFLAELMVAFQWFNPFAWWLKKSMVENHEFIVDRKIVQNGIDSRKYQYLLLNLSSGSNKPAVVNYFNTNLLKKRIRMMNKTKSPKWHGLKNGMVLISIAIVVAFTATFETKIIAQNSNKDPLVIVNGKKSDQKIQQLDPNNIQQINVIKDKSAMSKYGKDAKDGVIEITTKDTLNPSKSGTMEEIKVVGFGNQKPDSIGIVRFTSESGVKFTIDDKTKMPLIFLDGKKVSCEEINRANPHELTMIDGKEAISKYGEEGKNNVYLFYSSIQGQATVALRNEEHNLKPIYIVNGKIISEEKIKLMHPEDIKSITVLTGSDAIAKYEDKGKNGVVEITLKNAPPDKNLIIAPNPASDNVEVTLKDSNTNGIVEVKIYNKFGEIIYQDKKSGSSFSLSVSRLKPDSYILTVSDGSDMYKGILIVSR